MKGNTIIQKLLESQKLTMELYAQSDMESMRDAQGKFLEQLMGDKLHLLTERVQ